MTVEGGLDEPAELEPAQGSLDLASAEDTWSSTDWEAQAAAVLRKAKRLRDTDPDALVWDKLARTTLDGIVVTPLGTASLLEGLETSGRPTRSGDWDIRSYVDGRDAKQANEEALLDLDGGVTSLWLRVDADTDLETLLDRVLLDLAPVVLDGGDPAAFLSYLQGRELHPETNLGVPAADATAELAEAARKAEIRGFVVDATAVHDRGASDVQELGWSMAAGATYLRTLVDAGLSVDEAADLVEFRYAATDEQFATIAKLRAARRLWARVLEMSGASGREMRLHAVTSRPMMSKYDPWVNMLRTTVAAFAAGVGGADSVTVLPFDSPLGRPDALGRRIARNTSHLLIDESHVAHVADPAGGSYAVEKLTDDLARAAWEVFGRIDDGADLDAEIAATVAKREARDRPAQAPDHRAHRVPQPRRDAAGAGAERRVGRRTPLRRQLRGAARRAPDRPRLPGHPRHRRAAHRAGDLRHQPAGGRWHRGRGGRARRPAGRLRGRHRRGLRRVGGRDRGRAAEQRRRVGDRRRASPATGPTTPARWASTRSTS